VWGFLSYLFWKSRVPALKWQSKGIKNIFFDRWDSLKMAKLWINCFHVSKNINEEVELIKNSKRTIEIFYLFIFTKLTRHCGMLIFNLHNLFETLAASCFYIRFFFFQPARHITLNFSRFFISISVNLSLHFFSFILLSTALSFPRISFYNWCVRNKDMNFTCSHI
jgi:hypothetical protein